MRHNPLADALSVIKNAENAGKKECILDVASNMLQATLDLMKEKGYIESWEIAEKKEGGKIKVKLKGQINDCKSILPQFSVKKTEYEKWEKRYLPAANVGMIVVSTPSGVIAHDAAKGTTGGILIAYVY
ncbi:30S ribosomal protein S8 [archaeon]|nr:30S ribosomal protein S8 [archaeon]